MVQSENSGWQNFRPDNGGVTVNDTCLSGYAWAENIGWVKLGSGTGHYGNTTSANWGVNKDSVCLQWRNGTLGCVRRR